jgi:hypothetical protein
VVTGCLNAIHPSEVQAALAGLQHAAMLGPSQLDELDGVFHSAEAGFRDIHSADHYARYTPRNHREGLYQIIVNVGCTGLCTFCSIRRATGRPKSTPLDVIRQEIQLGLDQGYRDFFLAGTDVAAWGVDIGASVVDLFEMLTRIPEKCLFSAESFEPSRLIENRDDILPLVATGRFAWLVIAMQSGSQRILDEMKRPYSVLDCLGLVRTFKEADPNVIVSTDMIYGFADETRAEFEATIEAARRFDWASFNAYDPRPGTPPLLVPPDEMAYRRGVVMGELRRQGRQIDVLTANRIVPYTRDPGDGPPPTTARARRQWGVEHARKFHRIIERTGGISLPMGWFIHAAEEDPQLGGVVLRARRAGTEDAMSLLLCVPDAQRASYAHSDRFSLTILSQGDTLSQDREAAVAVLCRQLGLAPGR